MSPLMTRTDSSGRLDQGQAAGRAERGDLALVGQSPGPELPAVAEERLDQFGQSSR